MKRSWIKKQSSSPLAKIKRDIQKELRRIVIIRDGGCILRHCPEAGECGGLRKDGLLILQAEHLNTRERNISYADSRLVVCLCLRHHFYFKKQFGALYWKLIEKKIGKKRWELLQRVLADKGDYHKLAWDWQKDLLALQQESKQFKVDYNKDLEELLK